MNKILCIIIIFSYLFSENSLPIKGCTSPLAKNYNRDATEDDGSCIFDYSTIQGCTNPLAKNYNRDATKDDGTCIFNDEDDSQKKPKPRLVPIEVIYGCMDTLACNYNIKANENDDTCNYLDQCNVCGGNNSTCIDCLGIINGAAIEDKCGVCDSNQDNNCIQDCNGDWGGNAEFDQCGVCQGDNSNCIDCSGVVGGNATKDKCGVCDSNPDNDCIQDCKGDWGSNAEFDQCGVCDGDDSTCSGCMDETASNYDSNVKIDNRLLCDYDLVFEESSIDGYTDREYTKIDYIVWDIDTVVVNAIVYSNLGLTFGYEGDIYKKNNFLLSIGCELMLGKEYKKGDFKDKVALQSIYLAPIINIPKHNIAIYSRLGINILSSRNSSGTDMIFQHFKSWDYGYNAAIGIVFLINEIRILLDYNFHKIYGPLDNSVGFHRVGVSIYHNLISKLRDK